MAPLRSSEKVDEVFAFADATMATSLGSGRSLRTLARQLGDEERLLALGAGVSGGRKSLLAATSLRLLFVTPSRFGTKLVEVAVGSIDRIDIGVRLAGSVLTIRTAEGTILVRGMAHAEAAGLEAALNAPKQQPRSA